ncbi:conserved hypothetical protein [Solidesulfovibrio fructosivorans JJ]]|uniref:Uncharacterized protein n=1 Tax=Solidesulfovibrio fructosivorans JJ] TaxID=596151 RepID=E1K1I2_SOLFR|nr:hypothetical protein [Solidesulfovibrio fructosivorans]EFL49537.1 conserved hypothetical protein [Solidesulfovibrio fructosivorans JJ]]
MRKILAGCLGVWLVLVLVGTALAASGDIPPALAPWEGFALHGAAEKLCPPRGNDAKARICLFPASLTFDVTEGGADFSLRARLFDESAVPLPFAPGVWIEKATIGGKNVPVVTGEEGPQVWLAAGEYDITGRLAWNKEPEGLVLPAGVGLVRLSRRGVAVPVAVSPAGELRLGGPDAAKPVANSEHVRVFRLLADGVPMTVTTLFRLDVSGLARSITLAGAVPPGAFPLAVRAPVAASLGPDGSLVLDAGPGRYDVEVTARYPGPVGKIGPIATPYGREIWSYRADPNLRQTRAEGLAAIDPKTADVPEDWRSDPAFAVTAGAHLAIRELGRGVPTGRDALNLRREMWLDFSGKGLSVRDNVSGENRSAWTLSLLPPGELGRVVMDGRDQPVVLVGGKDARGVELRTAHLSLAAHSRYPDAGAAIPAGGFDREFERITTRLNLSPGWGLLAAFGPDTVRGGLLSPWSLLDLFLVFLLVVVAVGLRGPLAGATLGVFLLLSWHEPDAPTAVWLFVLAGAGLLRLAGEGGRFAGRPGFHRFAVVFFGFSLLTLIVTSIPFAADQLRRAVAPQIGQPVFPGSPEPRLAGGRPPAPAPSVAPRTFARKKSLENAPALLEMAVAPEARDAAGGGGRLEFDPNAVIQTGPAMPDWHFAAVTMEWKGPVAKGQIMRLVFVPPFVSSLLGFARVAFLGLALFFLCDRARLRRSRNLGRSAVAGLALLVGVAGMSQRCLAGDFPDKALLDTLRDRLTEPARCLPHCLGGSGLDVRLEDGRLNIVSLVDAAARVAAPLPAVSENWRPDAVRVDGAPGATLVRDGDSLFVLLEPGRHEVALTGPAPTAVSFRITPGLTPPGRVRIRAPGYRTRGLDSLGGLSGPLELTRAEPSAAGSGGDTPIADIPPFFEVTRALRFGLAWEVETVVRRRSPHGGAVVASVPLLPGEMPDTAGVTVKDGLAEAPFAAGQERVSWRSHISPAGKLVLTAPNGADMVTTWTVEAAPFYDVTFQGLPPVGIVAANGSWRPRFAPWPGETLTCDIRRPEAAPGETLTIERAALTVRQGRQMRDSELFLTFRSAKGARHAVRLPTGAEVTRLAVAGRETLPTGKDGAVGFALPPGVTDVSLRFREPVGTGTVLRTPAPDLGLPAASARTRLVLPSDRWLVGVFADTRLGPAVLYWGWLAVVVALGLLLAAIPGTPLSRWQWFVYALGLSQATPLGFVLATGWLAALAWRRRAVFPGTFSFDAVQVLLALLVLAGLAGLYDILDAGLLGLPRMQVAGNGSTATELVWTWGRVAGTLPAATVVSGPMAVFRALMLAWALWLAWLLPRWLRWGFDSFTMDGGWRALRFSWKRSGRNRQEKDAKQEENLP